MALLDQNRNNEMCTGHSLLYMGISLGEIAHQVTAVGYRCAVLPCAFLRNADPTDRPVARLRNISIVLQHGNQKRLHSKFECRLS